jgi:hypothetical protein
VPHVSERPPPAPTTALPQATCPWPRRIRRPLVAFA